jgi:hypothetical protein
MKWIGWLVLGAAVICLAAVKLRLPPAPPEPSPWGVPDATLAPAGGKPRAGLDLAFEEPWPVAAGRSLPVRLRIAGRPGEEVKVVLFGSPGVDISAFLEPTAVRLDEEGQATLAFWAAAPEPAGCSIVAHVEVEDGRVQEVHCTLGGAGERPAPEVIETSEGQKLRVSPAW